LLSSEIAKRIESRKADYRDINDGPYDRVVSIGMAEHVRHENFRTYMEAAYKNLSPDGLFLLHTIGSDKSPEYGENWTQKYIFPNSEIPSSTIITQSYQDLFVMEDWHNFGSFYEKTCLEWFKRFDKNWDKIKHLFE